MMPDTNLGAGAAPACATPLTASPTIGRDQASTSTPLPSYPAAGSATPASRAQVLHKLASALLVKAARRAPCPSALPGTSYARPLRVTVLRVPHNRL